MHTKSTRKTREKTAAHLPDLKELGSKLDDVKDERTKQLLRRQNEHLYYGKDKNQYR